MGEEKDMQKLLLKFIQQECNAEEIEEIIAYVKKAKGTEGLPSFEEVLSLMDELPETEHDKAATLYANVLKKAKDQSSHPRTRIWRYASVAAIFIGILTLGYFYQQGYFDGNTETILIPVQEAITLEFDNGAIEILNEDGTTQVVNADGTVVGTQQGNQLVYTNDGTSESLVYNTLKVPYGKRFEVQLADGTQVFLNAGTSLKYPLKFLKGEKRQVYLKGEAFFKVAKDVMHPFIVNADALNVQVLGTEFNVSNYSEDSVTDVVLVEGSVGMYPESTVFDKSSSTLLLPGTKGSFDRNTTAIETKEVITSTYTSWVDGRLIFRNMTLDNILKKLERHYNIDIQNSNNELGHTAFNAGFQNETINEVLEALQTTYGISYTIENNQVIIK